MPESANESLQLSEEQTLQRVTYALNQALERYPEASLALHFVAAEINRTCPNFHLDYTLDPANVN